MKTSILIIAHNEEAHIRECIESILNQSQKADEIVLIAHNCTDNTLSITQGYPTIRVYELKTDEKGPQYARKYGFEKVSGDIIACIDGDGVATEKWFENLIKPFENPEVVGVGGRVWFYESIMANLSSLVFFLTALPVIRHFFPFFFWGANFACRTSIYREIGGFESIIGIPEKLGLHYPAEDALLSFSLEKRGKVVYSKNAVVRVYIGGYFDHTDRGRKQREDNRKIRKYFGK